MRYYIKETIFDETRNRTAASKAREDINSISEEMGFLPIGVEYDYSLRKRKGFYYALKRLTNDWREALNRIGNGDTIFIQFPLNHHPLHISKYLDRIHKRGGKVIILIHDIDSFRMEQNSIVDYLKYLKVKKEDISILRRGDVIIAHNARMRNAIFEDFKLNKDSIITLDIFDYLVDDEIQYNDEVPKEQSVVIAGTLRKGKSGYVYALPNDVAFNLYGVGYEDEHKENIKYNGSFNPCELVSVMHGTFGLVWDGNSPETCDGLTGKYLALNNPHKTSLYLVSGLPVIIWEKAALASFVIDNKCGITINNLGEIKTSLLGLSQVEYDYMRNRAKEISKELRCGTYSKRAINKALEMLNDKV